MIEVVNQTLLLTAQAQSAGDSCQSMALFMVVIFSIFYFIVIRPQSKEQEKQRQFLERLIEGDRVITTSGIFGRITALDKDVVTIDVGDRTRIRFLRNQVVRYQQDVNDSNAPENNGKKEIE
jgi:preprotein translocase subunit YajC